MKSIMQDDKECYICKTTKDLHMHHIYGGYNRKHSDKHGFTVWLCGTHHNLSNEGVHFNKEFDSWLKEECQKKYEETHAREEFMQIIGRNYLED